ncbi:hypothetical protein [Delftia sp. WSY_7]
MDSFEKNLHYLGFDVALPPEAAPFKRVWRCLVRLKDFGPQPVCAAIPWP